MTEVSLRIDTAQPARPDQAIQQGCTLATVVAAEEDVVLTARKARSAALLSASARTSNRICKEGYR